MAKQNKNSKATTKTNFPCYQNDFEYIEDHFILLDFFAEQKQIEEEKSNNDFDHKKLRDIKQKINEQSQKIQERRKISKQKQKTFSLDKIVSKYRLRSIEKKILIFLLYRHFSSDSHGTSGRVILGHVTENRLEIMRVRHYLMENSKLRNNKLIIGEETLGERSILEQEFSIPENIVSRILGETTDKPSRAKKQERSYKHYLNLWFSLVSFMEEKTEISSMLRNDGEGDSLHFWEGKENARELKGLRYNIRKTRKNIEDFGKYKSEFPLEQVAAEYQLNEDEKMVLVVLLRDSLGLSDGFIGYEGKRILAIISESENEMIGKRSLLYKKNKLRRNELLRMERNWGGQNILDAEYFLSEKMIRRLLGDGLDEDIPEQDDDGQILLSIAPRFSFADVIIAEAKKEYIEIALSQQMNRDLIFKQWGFEKSIPYGNALTMMFSGPPGTGKTMMAEAVAHFLGKKLLIANYSQIQNLYVGETEKRIVSTFKKAQEEQGVLLWDEADSMFFSREIARNSWEYRDVNVILQELEKFTGEVILTTNRKIALDGALERRIAVKIDFEMPEVKEREAIWKALLPNEAPIDKKVDFRRLAEKYAVAGGIIKNAILHAARLAAYRKSASIAMQDFERGMKMEVENSWENREKIGFGAE